MAHSLKETKLRVLHTADWHVCNEFIEDAERCLDFMASHIEALNESVDLIVISGDIYNHRQIQQETESARLAFRTVQRLSNCAPVIILTGTPSHDGNAPLILAEIGGGNVKVMDHPGQLITYRGDGYLSETLPAGADSPAPPLALISCVPAFTKQYFESGSDIATSDKEIADALANIFAGFGTASRLLDRKYKRPVPHIVLGHGAIGGAFIHPSQPMIGKEVEIAQEHLTLALPSINCFGHLHAAQRVNANTYFSGSLFSTDFGEYEDKGFYIHDLEPVDMGHHWEPVKSDFVLTPSPKLVKLNVDLILNPVEDETILLQSIMMVADHTPALDVDTDEGHHIVCRMEIKVYQDEAKLIDEDAIKEYFGEMGLRSFDLTLTRIPRPNVRSAKIMEADRLRDKVVFRSGIVNNPVTSDILDKADVLQVQAPEILIDELNAQIRKEKENNELAKG